MQGNLSKIGRKLRVFAILMRVEEIHQEIRQNNFLKTEPLKITDPYKDLPKLSSLDYKSGKELRREKRKKNRKNK